jgi:hypothetical protein
MTLEQEKERIENLGGTLLDDKYAIFRFSEPVSNDKGETITLQEALAVEGQMIDSGYEGALIGHPFDLSDDHCIYFEIH